MVPSKSDKITSITINIPKKNIYRICPILGMSMYHIVDIPMLKFPFCRKYCVILMISGFCDIHVMGDCRDWAPDTGHWEFDLCLSKTNSHVSKHNNNICYYYCVSLRFLSVNGWDQTIKKNSLNHSNEIIKSTQKQTK